MISEKLVPATTENRPLAQALTAFLHNTVPLAKMFDLNVDLMSVEKTICSLEATPSAMNQNGTLQASTFYILADYAVGLAGYASLPDFAVLGMPTRQPKLMTIQGWLKDGYVKHIKPATGSIRAEVKISADEQLRIRTELLALKKSTYVGEVNIFQGETLVAIARHTVVFVGV